MAASEALSVQGESAAAAPGPSAASEAVSGPAAGAASQRRGQLIPVAQLVAIVLGVFAIIWNQQQTTDSLRTELSDEITSVESELRAEIAALRAEVSANGQRLARIEGFLGIGTPEALPDSSPP